MSALFFDRPRALVIVLALLFVGGLSSAVTIVKQEDPTITNGVAVIVTAFPGASAERVESRVTEKIEDELRELAEIQTLNSVSASGVSVVTVELDERILGDDVEPAFSKVRDALDDVRLPPGALEPSFDDERFGSYTLTVGLVWDSSEPLHRGILSRWAETLQDRFRDVPGTDHAKVFGAPQEVVRVSFDPDALSASGLRPARFAHALARADAKVAAGALHADAHDVPIELRGELDSLERIRQVPVLPGADGALLQVGDVATVERAHVDPPGELAIVDGRPAVLVAAQLAAGQPFDRWISRMEPVLGHFETQLPSRVRLERVFDQTVYTEQRLSVLFSNLLQGLALVVAVLFVTLGLRSALIVTLTLPLVSLASVSILRLGGVPIHQMSVTGLIVALGLLVDNAIVMVDAIRAKRLRGVPPRDAVVASVRHLAVPLFASTFTTVLAFMPILLLQGRVGEFVGTIGLSVIIALITSYVLAMTVVPALAGRFAVAGSDGASRSSFLREGFRWPGGTRWFSRSLDSSLRHPWISVLGVSLLPLLGFAGASTLPRQFFPPADRDQINLEVRLAPSASIGATRDVVDRVDRLLRDEPGVVRTTWTVGKSAPPFYYNLRQNKDGRASFAQALVQAESVAAVQRLIPRIQHVLDREVPEAQVLVKELLQGPPVDAPVELRIYGADLQVLRRVGEAYRERMSRIPEVTHTTMTLTAGAPKLWLDADEAEVAGMGLGLVDLAGQLALRLDGVRGGTVLEGDRELPIEVRATGPERRTLVGIRRSRFQVGAEASSGGVAGVPLESLGDLTLEPALARVPHRNGLRVNVVRAFVGAGVYPETAQTALAGLLQTDPVELPPGTWVETGGDAAERADAMGNLFASVPVLVLLMVATVTLSLGSFRLGGVVFGVAFQSIGLGLLSLTLFRHPLGFQAMIGLIGLVGVAINAAIVIQSALRTEPRALAGDREAIRESVVTESSRHIISTTVTTFGGFLPLILTEGGFWPPFATGIAGGVVLSTLVSFYFVPAAFLLMTRGPELSKPSSEPSPRAPAEVHP